MIAKRNIHGRFGGIAFKILEGRSIPSHIIRHLDIKRLIAEGVIEDDKKPSSEKSSEKIDKR